MTNVFETYPEVYNKLLMYLKHALMYLITLKNIYILFIVTYVFNRN